jgi:DNA-binding transcriptional MerR regulator
MAKKQNSFSGVEAARFAGLPYRTVDYWCTTGFIVPSITDAKGRGTERKYAFDDLVALRVARGLRKAGISMQAIRRIVDSLPADAGSIHPLAQSRLIAVGSDIKLVTGNAVFSVLKQPGQAAFAFMFDLRSTVQEIKKAINQGNNVKKKKKTRVA